MKAPTRTCLNGQQLLDAGPLRQWLASLPREVLDSDLERTTGVPARIVYAVRRGDRKQVTLDTADKLTTLFTGSPELLDRLYPVEESRAA